MDECEPDLMGKNLTGVKDSYIMLYIYKRQNVFFLQTKFARFLSGPQVQNNNCSDRVCVPESIADKLVCLHKCADNVETNWFVCTCVQTMCRQTGLSA